MIDYNILEGKKHIWMSLSGGTDSALIFFLITKWLYENNKTTKITPWCLYDSYRPGNDIDAQNVIDVVKDLIPYEHIQPMITGMFSKHPGTNKVALTKPFWTEMQQTRKYDIFVSALTASPSVDEMKKEKGFYDAFLRLKDENRDPAEHKIEIQHDDEGMTIWHPVSNIDKKAIAAGYEEHDLMDNLFPLTTSCVSRHKTPCFECFWCYEKHWAFGMYDIKGGIVVPLPL